ncbi:coiled-coil domain-containing protein 170 [Octopus bimaculoides]|uniref:Coiled-coil domain-containing protein 170 n=1 Tax=Octopus bimaculoides TaxID=37653 RepID=A0A0L8GZI7_OCTBM|nr:coiled-coil domain-containing protein 170 [Octopus bimaculoides]|eukprot:XP_014776748.1 PREDICTED: coiled-coil domain-containing protein 170-like [Octopus bimaculoides]
MMTSYLKDSVDQEKLPSLSNTWNGHAGATLTRISAARSTEDALPFRSNSTNVLSKMDSHSFRPPSPSQTRRNMLDLQEQLKSFKEEMAKKDNLIQQLTSVDDAAHVLKSPSKYFDSYVTSSLSQIEQQKLDRTHSELANLQIKNEKLASQLRDYGSHVDEKDMKIKELQNQLDISKTTENNLLQTIQTLKQSFQELENRSNKFESVSNRAEIAISTFQKDNRELQDKILDLEARLRKQLDEREQAESQSQNWQMKFNDLVTKTNSILGSQDGSLISYDNLEPFYAKLSDTFQENAMLRGKLITLTEMLNNSEMESKASRETIMRLVSEVGREQKTSSHNSYELNCLKMERDNALDIKKNAEREVSHLKEQVLSCQRALDSCQNELKLRENQMSLMNRDVRESGQSMKTTQSQLLLLREQIATILTDHYNVVQATDEDIKQRCQQLMFKNQEYGNQINFCEKEIKKLLDQLESQHDLHQTAIKQLKLTEIKCADLEEKLYKNEEELATGDILRSSYKTSKEKYMKCLEELSEIMKMDTITKDTGFDLTIDAILARAEQLVKLESTALAERSTQVYGQQKKLKALKEQLTSKDLHLDLLRKKISNLEELLHGRSDLEKERDSESMRVRKLEKVIEKYKAQLKESISEKTDLKARLLESSDLKVHSLEQEKDLEELAKEVEELKKIRLKQAQRISCLEVKCKSQEEDKKDKCTSSQNTIHSLSSELHTTKNALTAITNREKQLLDFRNVIGRMLGLDLTTLAIPDYEIISRLEKLIQSHHMIAMPHMSLAQLEDGFVSGYEEAVQNREKRTQTAGAYARRWMDQRRRRPRARSVSPVQVKRDPRSY